LILLFSEPIGLITNSNPNIEIGNSKWFDKPFDRLTVLSMVEGLTTLSGRL
jgi:hypothetical protein